MQILYNVKTDLLCLRLDDRKQQVIDKRLSEDIVLDLAEDNRIVGIEILDASKHLNLERLLPVKYEVSPEAKVVSYEDLMTAVLWPRPGRKDCCVWKDGNTWCRMAM